MCVWSCVYANVDCFVLLFFFFLPAEEKPWPDKPLIYMVLSARMHFPWWLINFLPSIASTITWLLRDTNTPKARNRKVWRNVDSFDMFIHYPAGECDVIYITWERSFELSVKLAAGSRWYCRGLLLAFCICYFRGSFFFWWVTIYRHHHHQQQQPFSYVDVYGHWMILVSSFVCTTFSLVRVVGPLYLPTMTAVRHS